MAEKATKDRVFTVREGRKFHAIVDGSRKTLTAGMQIKGLTDDQVMAFGDVFEETDEHDKSSYRADTPDGNPDTTKVVTQGMGDGRIASPTIGPAEAGQAAPVRPGTEAAEDQVPLEPVTEPVQGDGNSTSQSSSVQADTTQPADAGRQTTAAPPAAEPTGKPVTQAAPEGGTAVSPTTTPAATAEKK
jgi:hypothetical protein